MKYWFFNTALLVFGSLILPAADASDTALESVLVSANAPVEQSESLLENLDTITGRDIRIRQPADIPQLLDGVEGVFASREGGPGGVNSLSIRGAEPNFTVVLLDGVPVNDPTNTRGGSFDLATLSTSHVRRVELIKGPRSVAFGSDAMAGVLKLISVPGNDEMTGLRLSHETQEYGASRSAGAATLANGAHALNVRGTQEDSGTVWEGSERELTETALHYRLTLDNSLLQIGGRDAEFEKTAYPEQSGGPRFAQSDARDHSEGRDQTAYLSGEVSPRENWRISAQYGEYDRQLDYHSPGIAPYNHVPENFYVADYQRKQWRVVSELSFANVNFNVGADRRWEEGVSEGAVIFSNVPVDAVAPLLGLPSPPVESGLAAPITLALDTDYSLRRTTEGRFLEANWQTEASLVLSAGIRRDNTDSGRETVRRYLAGIPLWDWGRANLSYSEGFKSPSFFALGHGLVGNPELKPERVESFQLDVSAELGRIDVELAIFDTHYTDLIDFDADTFTNVNRDSVLSRGGELVLQTRWENATLSGSVSHVVIEVENTDRNLANRPQNTVTLEANWQPTERLSWHHRIRWVDRRFATSLHTGETREYILDDYALWDTVLRWQASAQLALTIGLENVSDNNYQEAVGFPGAGQRLRMGVDFTR